MTHFSNIVETLYRWDAGYTVLNEEDDPSAGLPIGNLTRGYVDRNMAQLGKIRNPNIETRSHAS